MSDPPREGIGEASDAIEAQAMALVRRVTMAIERLEAGELPDPTSPMPTFLLMASVGRLADGDWSDLARTRRVEVLERTALLISRLRRLDPATMDLTARATALGATAWMDRAEALLAFVEVEMARGKNVRSAVPFDSIEHDVLYARDQLEYTAVALREVDRTWPEPVRGRIESLDRHLQWSLPFVLPRYVAAGAYAPGERGQDPLRFWWRRIV